MDNFGEILSDASHFATAITDFRLPMNHIAALKPARQRRNGSRASDDGGLSAGPSQISARKAGFIQQLVASGQKLLKTSRYWGNAAGLSFAAKSGLAT